jgi:hypothetical protein
VVGGSVCVCGGIRYTACQGDRMRECVRACVCAQIGAVISMCVCVCVCVCVCMGSWQLGRTRCDVFFHLRHDKKVHGQKISLRKS